MAMSSRRKRRAFRNPKRVHRGGSLSFNAAVLAIVVVGTVLVAVSRHPNSAGAVGPKLKNDQGVADHWHAAIGVNICGTWQPGPIWPNQDNGELTRAGDPGVYAGLHTHTLANGQSDGLIHMEPVATSEAGRNATVGKWTEYGGWKLSSTSMSLWPGANGKAIKEKNGDKCGKQVGELRWAVGEFSEGKTTKLSEHTGDPAHFKLYNDNVVAIYFVPKTAKLSSYGKVPSEANLPDASSTNGVPTTTPTNSTTPIAPTTTVKGATTTTVAGATTTSPPTTAATSTTTP
jgi:hypothetical protein